MIEEEPKTGPNKIHETVDPWAHRSTAMKCASCMFYINFRCRRHAPTLQGYPAVYPSDWCGDYKKSKESMGGT